MPISSNSFIVPENGVQIIGEAQASQVDVSYAFGDLRFNYENVPVAELPQMHREKLDLGWLPPMVRYLSDDHSLIVYERPPEIKKLNFLTLNKNDVEILKNDADDLSSHPSFHSFDIFLPWQVYVVKLMYDYTPEFMYVFSRDSQITSMNDTLYCMPLPNLYGDGKVCSPVMSSMKDKESENVAEALQYCYNMFWSSGFNYDLVNSVYVALRGGFFNKLKSIDPINVTNVRRRFPIGNRNRDDITKFFSRWSTSIGSIEDMNFCLPGSEDLSRDPMGSGEDESDDLLFNIYHALQMLEEKRYDMGSPSISFINKITNAATNSGKMKF